MANANSASKPDSKSRSKPMPVAPQLSAKARPEQELPQQRPAPARPRALILSVGVAGGIGKSLNADVVSDLCRIAKLPAKVIRLESGARREEFPGDAFVDLDAFSETQSTLGGVAARFDPA